MAEIIYDDSVGLSLIQSKRIAIVGYDPQSHAHALDLKDSGVDVVVGPRLDSPSRAKAEAAGPEVKDVAKAIAESDVISALLSGQVQRYVYAKQIASSLRGSAVLLSAHGFDIRYGYVKVSEGYDVVTAAPKGLNHKARETYTQGEDTPDVVAVEVDAPDQVWDLVLPYAKTIGGTRTGVIKTTFTEGTETDLLGERAVLRGGVFHLIRAGFETLVGAGYQPEIVHFEVYHEMKQIVDLINGGGITKQCWSCSDTAKYGDYAFGPRVINESSKEAMKAVLIDIQDDTLVRKFIADQSDGALELKALCAEEETHPIEKTGQKLHRAFGWTDPGEDYTEGSVAR